MRNEMVDTGGAGDEMFYRNITIEDNVIYNAQVHGITVGETHGLTIKNNTILRNQASGDDKLVHVPRIYCQRKIDRGGGGKQYHRTGWQPNAYIAVKHKRDLDEQSCRPARPPG